MGQPTLAISTDFTSTFDEVRYLAFLLEIHDILLSTCKKYKIYFLSYKFAYIFGLD